MRLYCEVLPIWALTSCFEITVALWLVWVLLLLFIILYIVQCLMRWTIRFNDYVYWSRKTLLTMQLLNWIAHTIWTQCNIQCNRAYMLECSFANNKDIIFFLNIKFSETLQFAAFLFLLCFFNFLFCCFLFLMLFYFFVFVVCFVFLLFCLVFFFALLCLVFDFFLHVFCFVFSKYIIHFHVDKYIKKHMISMSNPS